MGYLFSGIATIAFDYIWLLHVFSWACINLIFIHGSWQCCIYMLYCMTIFMFMCCSAINFFISTPFTCSSDRCCMHNQVKIVKLQNENGHIYEMLIYMSIYIYTHTPIYIVFTIRSLSTGSTLHIPVEFFQEKKKDLEIRRVVHWSPHYSWVQKKIMKPNAISTKRN